MKTAPSWCFGATDRWMMDKHERSDGLTPAAVDMVRKMFKNEVAAPAPGYPGALITGWSSRAYD